MIYDIEVIVQMSEGNEEGNNLMHLILCTVCGVYCYSKDFYLTHIGHISQE